MLCESCAILLLCTELGRDREYRHNRGVVNRVTLHFIAYGNRIFESLGICSENLRHLARGLHPLLLRVEHSLRVIEVLTRTQTDKTVVRLGIALLHEVDIVGADQADIVFARELHQLLIDLQLHRVCLVIGSLHSRFV